MGKIIEVYGLMKSFTVHHRENAGLLSAFKSLFVRKFKTVQAVNNISFSVNRGTVHALIGPNGSGKSTTIKILSGILYPSGGIVKVMNYIPWMQRREYVKHIGVLFGQKSQLGWEIPALDTFKIHKELYKIPAKDFKNNLDFLIQGFRIEDIVTKPVRTLSLGERMRCEIVCILLHMPDLVFLDEPTIGLDIEAKEIFRELIKKLNREKGITFILTTHDLNEVESLCGSATVINHGRIVFDGKLEELKMRFSYEKIIEIAFSRPLPALLAEEMNVEMHSPMSGTIHIDLANNDIQEEIARIFSKLPVRDINIQTINIESIIKILYRQKRTGTKESFAENCMEIVSQARE